LPRNQNFNTMFQPKSFQEIVRLSIAQFSAKYNETTQDTFRAFRKQLRATGIEDERVAFEFLSQGADLN
jgi:hypothetical protein